VIPANLVLGMGMEISVGLMCTMNAFPLESPMVTETLPGAVEVLVPPALL